MSDKMRTIRTDWSLNDTEFTETDTSVITDGKLIRVLVNHEADCVLTMGISQAKRIAEGILAAVAAANERHAE